MASLVLNPFQSVFRSVITSKGSMKLTEDEAEELIASVDADGDNHIAYDEFIQLFTKKD